MAIPIENRRQPHCSVAAFGRVFFGAKNRLYFSQVYDKDEQALGKMYQQNDPTSDEFSDVLATDGGEIRIPEAGKIYQLLPFYNGICILASNGTWYLAGGQGGFSATQYSLQKVDPFGALGRKCGVEHKGVLYYCTTEGIMRLGVTDSGVPFSQNVTESTINTFFEEFIQTSGNFVEYDESRIACAADPAEKQIVWINTYSPVGTKGLMLDLRVNAWYPMQYSNSVTDILYIKGRGLVLHGGRNVYDIKEENGFTDYPSTSYEYYIQTQPETLNRFTHRKNAPNIYAIFRKTEENITGYAGDEWQYDYPSACRMSVIFDFDKDSYGNKVSPPKNIYKANRRNFWPDSFPSSIQDGASTVEYRDIIRGNGKAVQFRFEGESGKDMQLLGYSVEYSTRGRQ